MSLVLDLDQFMCSPPVFEADAASGSVGRVQHQAVQRRCLQPRGPGCLGAAAAHPGVAAELAEQNLTSAKRGVSDLTPDLLRTAAG
jgi:hypothetical protein